MKKMMLATKLIGGFVIVAVLEEFVERIKSWCHSGFDGFAGEEIPDIAAAVQIGLYMARSPASTTRRITGSRGFTPSPRTVPGGSSGRMPAGLPASGT